MGERDSYERLQDRCLRHFHANGEFLLFQNKIYRLLWWLLVTETVRKFAWPCSLKPRFIAVVPNLRSAIPWGLRRVPGEQQEDFREPQEVAFASSNHCVIDRYHC